jgi:hypothetical protein
MMRKRICIALLLAFGGWHGLSEGQEAKLDKDRGQPAQVGPKLPQMPGAVFLLGSAPNGVWLSTPGGEMKVQTVVR